MIYKFKSKASGDVVMLGADGDRVLRLLGREPAPRGIFEPQHMPALRQTLLRALADAEAVSTPGGPGAGPGAEPGAGRSDRGRDALDRSSGRGAGRDLTGDGVQDGEGEGEAVGLRQRLWPLLQMLERAAAAAEPIVWGV